MGLEIGITAHWAIGALAIGLCSQIAAFAVTAWASCPAYALALLALLGLSSAASAFGWLKRRGVLPPALASFDALVVTILLWPVAGVIFLLVKCSCVVVGPRRPADER